MIEYCSLSTETKYNTGSSYFSCILGTANYIFINMDNFLEILSCCGRCGFMYVQKRNSGSIHHPTLLHRTVHTSTYYTVPFIASQGTNSAKFPGTMDQKWWRGGFVVKGSCYGICIVYVYTKRMLKLVVLIKHNAAHYRAPSTERRRQTEIDAAWKVKLKLSLP